MANPQQLESEVAQAVDLSVVRYSRVWEDHRVLSLALQVTAEDTVLSITSSGDNVLNLLLESPRKIFAVDMSHSQNAILELKLAAIRYLDYIDFLVLIGEKDDPKRDRLDIFQKVKPHLPHYARIYLDSHADMIEAGICNTGRLEKYIAAFFDEYLSKIVTPEPMDQLFTALSMEEQKTYYQALPLEEIREALCSHVSNLTERGRSPAQTKYVDDSNKAIVERIWRQFDHVCQTLPARDNFYLNFWLRGWRGYDPSTRPEFAAPYLRKENFLKLRGLIDRVEVFTGTVESLMSQPEDLSISKANLSDIFEYMSEENTDLTFALLADKMTKGCRIAFWNAFVPRKPSASLCEKEKIELLDSEAARLRSMDRLFYYRAFHIAQIK